MRCNRIAVKDAITGKLLPHYSVKDPSCKMRDIGVKRCSGNLSEWLLWGSSSISQRYPWDMEEISKDDKMFLAIVESGTKKVDEHYEVPLPCRDGNLQLPNNKDQPIRRMQQLKKGLQKDLQQLHQADRRAYFKGICKMVIQKFN